MPNRSSNQGRRSPIGPAEAAGDTSSRDLLDDPVSDSGLPQRNSTRRGGRRWLMAQSWHDLLFAHWSVPLDQLRRVVPAPLTVDTFEDRAWLGIVAFRLSDVHLRGLPNAPGASRFPEVNVRTYVSLEGKPGVLFLSLHCPNRLAIALARPWFRLPYHYARVHLEAIAHRDAHAPLNARAPQDARAGALDFGCSSPLGADFAAAYRPLGAAAPSAPSSLAEFLTERYCYYSVAADGAVYRCDIQHAPWRLAPAEARIRRNTLTEPLGLHLNPDQPPICHVAQRMDALIWPLQRVVTPTRR